ncbi:hypothetical protein L209DRAFT_587878 [Thermothelomyces heterothallicus CBS 203.75]
MPWYRKAGLAAWLPIDPNKQRAASYHSDISDIEIRSCRGRQDESREHLRPRSEEPYYQRTRCETTVPQLPGSGQGFSTTQQHDAGIVLRNLHATIGPEGSVRKSEDKQGRKFAESQNTNPLPSFPSPSFVPQRNKKNSANATLATLQLRAKIKQPRWHERV